MADLVFDDVSFRYPEGTLALSHVALRVTGAELVTVVGPSGSGKTTLLQLAAGLLRPTAGTVQIDGQTVADQTPRDRDVAVMFGWRTIYEGMTAGRNVSFGLDVRGYPAEEIRDRVGAEARVLRILHLLARKPRTLSVGQRQRVVLGRALVRVPRVLLLDEPFNHLEPGERVRLRLELPRLVKGLGVTTALVTHDIEEAMAVGDRVAVLRDGSVEQVGTPRQLYARPGSLFVAGFVGSRTSLLRARLVADGTTAVAELGGQLLPLGPLYGAMRGYVGRYIVIALRPEDLREAAGDEVARLCVHVVRLEQLGAYTLVAGEYEPGAEVLARFPPDTRLAPGDTVDLAVRISRVHAFDPATGAVIQYGSGVP
jgi:ABC-type sugar transport system ATPase subunit